jgi:hypothetical protein
MNLWNGLCMEILIVGYDASKQFSDRIIWKSSDRNEEREIDILGTRSRSWLKHYAASQKVRSSNPDGIIGYFNWPNTSSRAVALRSSQPLREMSARNLPGVKGRPALKADNLTAICEPIV